MTDPIKAKIQELCPDVLELKFGCVLENAKGETLQLVPWLMTYSVDPLPHVLASSENEFINFQTTKILGSPITLAVVLRAIANEPADFRMWVDATTFEIPHFLMTKREWKEDEPILAWDLTKDYDQQSEECKQFIGSLLGV
jgi:hypothetical protein